MKTRIPNVRAKVVAFDQNTLIGIAVYDLTPVRFHSTSFSDGEWPRVGQAVELVFTERGDILSVHPIRRERTSEEIKQMVDMWEAHDLPLLV